MDEARDRGRVRVVGDACIFECSGDDRYHTADRYYVAAPQPGWHEYDIYRRSARLGISIFQVYHAQCRRNEGGAK